MKLSRAFRDARPAVGVSSVSAFRVNVFPVTYVLQAAGEVFRSAQENDVRVAGKCTNLKR